MNDINFGFIDKEEEDLKLKIQALDMDLVPSEPFTDAMTAVENLYELVDIQLNKMELDIKDFRVSQKNYEQAEVYKKQIQAIVKAVEGKKAELKAPHLDYNRAVDSFVRRVGGRLQAMKASISTKMKPILLKLQEKNRKAEEQAKASKKNVEKQAIRKTKAEVKTHIRKVPKFEIVDESKIPRSYMTPDHSKINKDIRAGKRKIAGLKIWEDEQVI